MTKRVALLPVLAAMLMVVDATAADIAAPGDSLSRWIAKPLDDAARALVAQFTTRTEPATGEVLLTPPPTVTADAASAWAASLRAAGRFAYIAPDEYCIPQDVPGDPLIGDQWYLQRLNLPQAWELTTGLPSVTVGVIDTGIDLTHPELLGRRVLGATAIDTVVWQSDLQDPIIDDVSGHGTEVSGVIAAETDNSLGIASVGRNIRLLPIRVSQNVAGGAFLSDILRGARAAADAGAVAVSVSYSGLTNPAVETTGQYITSAGSLLFWAAGNNAATLGQEFNWPNVIIVGATDAADSLASFSARGPALDLVAPGVSILTTARGGDFSGVNGTSFSAPIAAALAGLIKSANTSLTGQQIDAILRSTAADLGAAGTDDLFGNGRTDAFAAVAAASGRTTPVVLPDRTLALTGEWTLVPVLANDGDPLGRPLRVALGDSLPAQVGTAAVVQDPATGLDAIGIQIRPDAPLGEVSLHYAVRLPGQLSGGVIGSVTLKVDAAGQYTMPIAVPKVAAGLDAAYYQLSESPASMPDVTSLEAIREVAALLDISGSEAPPGPLPVANNFAAVYQGFLKAPTTGLYTIVLQGDDGASLTLGQGETAVSAASVGFAPASVTAKLRAGLHPLRVEQYHSDGPWGLRVAVGSGDGPAPVASSRWFCRRVLVADLVGAGGIPVPDGTIDGEDFLAFINAFAIGEAAADIAGGGDGLEPDGTVDGSDFIAFINAFAAGY
jgi:subtilisin family serine protease